MKSGRLRTVLLALILAMVSGGAWLSAQIPQGQILGTIVDQGGAAVPGATVTLKNELTGIVRTIITSDSGDYVFPGLDSGTYTVTVRKEGFRTVASTGIKVQVEERRRADVKLQVGQVQTTIEVSGAAAKVDTDTATLATMVSRREVKDLPLNGREFSQLATLMPGVRNAGTTGGALGMTFATAIAVGGTSAGKNSYSLDGADNTWDVWNGPAMNPSIDAIQEFRIDRSQFGAEYGRGGAQIELVTRNGTNRFHGAAWEYVRNWALNAGEYYSHAPDNLRRNQYGANIGGPIKPDKAFFFVNWEGQRENSFGQQIGTVLTEKMRSGDLSEFETPIIDPQTGEPFSGNVIPTERMDPVALGYMAAMLPHANLPGSAGGVLNNYLRQAPTKSNWDQYITRIDYNLTDKDKLFGHFAIQPWTYNPSPITATSYGSFSSLRRYNTSIGYTRNWTPHLISETRLSNHIERIFVDEDTPENSFVGAPAPAQVLQGYGTYQPPVGQMPIFFVDPYYHWVQWNGPWAGQALAFELVQSVSYMKGKHLLKAGFSGRIAPFNRKKFAENKIQESFNGFFSGNGLADYFLGLPYSANEALPPTARVQNPKDFSGYIEDDWRVSPSLTLNVGLRYEVATRIRERYDRYSSFDRENGLIILAGSRIRTEYAVAPLLEAYAPYIITANNTSLPPRTLAYGDHNNFAPRFGFAWRPFKDNKTVVRGGYGVFYVLRDGNTRGSNTAAVPYGGTISVTNTTSSPFTMGSPFGGQLNAPPPPGANWLDPHMRDGYLQQWTLGVQRELPGGFVFEGNYQHQLSLKLETGYNLNQPQAVASSPDLTPLQQRRPYPYLSSSVGAVVTDGRSRYDALELSVKKSSTHYTLQWNHTFAKNWASLDRTDPYNRDMWNGPTDYAPNLDKLNFVADLPFGKGRHWGNHGGVLNQVVGGWTFSGIGVLYQGGAPFTITWSGADPTNTGTYTARANQTCDGKISSPTVNQWFDTSCFGAPTDGTWGNAGTGILFGPRRFSYDLGLSKTFPIHEDWKLQFRSEFFNAFNHPNLGMPGTAANLAGFGVISTKNQTPRVIQFALRLEF